MFSTQKWRDNIQTQTPKRTYVVFDGVDLSQHIARYEMKDFLDLDGKSTFFGAIGVRDITIEILGNRPRYQNVTISHGILINEVWYNEELGTFPLQEPVYDERGDRTTYKIVSDDYNKLVTEPIANATNPIEYVQGQSVYPTDVTDWTLGSEIIVKESALAYYDTFKSMFIDMGKSTMSFAIPRKGKVAFRPMVETGYKLKWIFDLKLGEWMNPVVGLNLTTTLGDNVTAGSLPSENETMIEINNVELIRKNREENIDTMYGAISGLTYQQVEVEYVGDPFIELGDVIKFDDKDGNELELIVTKHEFKDTGAFSGIITCDILTPAESNTNFVGEYGKFVGETTAEVDKMNKTITLLTSTTEDLTNKYASLRLDVDSLTATVANMDAGTNIIANANGSMDYFGWTFDSQNKGIQWGNFYRWFNDMIWGVNFVPVEVHSLSKYGLKFVSKGKAISSVGYVVPDSKYSFKAKRETGTQRFKLTVIEFDKDMEEIKRTPFDFVTAKPYEEASIMPAQNTMYAQLQYETFDDNELLLTEIMFNRGEPATWRETPEDVLIWAQAQFVITHNEIKSTVEEIQLIDGRVSNNSSIISQLSNKIVLGVKSDGRVVQMELGADPEHGSYFTIKADSIALEGLTTINNGFQVLPNGDVKMVNADVSGKVTATSGTIGGYTIEGETLVGNDIVLSKNEIGIKGSVIRSYGGEIDFASGNIRISKSPNIGGDAVGIKLDNRSFATLDIPNNLLSLGVDMMSPRVSGYPIGGGNNRYSYIFLQNQPNVSSDRNLKYSISDMDELLLDSFEPLTEKSFKTKHDDMYSFGYIAQDVEDCLRDFVYKVWSPSDAEAQLHLFKILSRNGEFMSLLYAEVQVIVSAVLRRQNKRLEERLEKLEELYVNSK